MQHKAVLPNPAVLQSLKPQYYFSPDQVNLLVQSIITGRFRIITVSYIPMQITRAVSTVLIPTDDVGSRCQGRLIVPKYCPIAGDFLSKVSYLHQQYGDVCSTKCYQDCVGTVAGHVHSHELHRFTYFCHAAKCTNDQPEIFIQSLSDTRTCRKVPL